VRPSARIDRASSAGEQVKPGALGVGLLLLVVSLTILTGLSEIGLRIFCRESLGISRDERTMLYRYDEVLGWRPVANSSNRFVGSREITVVNNSLGFRAPEPVTNGHPGLMFLGDSFVWGYDVEAPERFTDKLQARHPEWNIYNLGVSGYGTDQEFLLLQMQFARYQPRVVFVVYSAETDEEDNSTNFRYEGYYKPYCTILTNRLQIQGLPVPRSERVFVAEHRLLARSYFVRLLARAWFKLTAPPVLFNPSPTGAILLNMQHFVHSQGAALAVGLTLPRPPLQEFLRHYDIPCVDLTTMLRYPTNGFHWTPEGHTVVCDRIDEFLTKGKFLGRTAVPLRDP
jgi:hypothetical protein